MKNILTIIAAIVCLNTVVAQDVKIKKGEILIDKQAVAKIEKQKTGYKISTIDGATWFTANAINFTQTKNKAPKFWLELTGANGNLREAEYRDLDFTFSKEKWHVEALLNSDTGLLTHTGVDKAAVDRFFETQDRNVSEKWDQIIAAQRAENEKEDELAKQDGLIIDGRTIKQNKEVIAFIQKEETAVGSLIRYTYTFVTNDKKHILGKISFYLEENMNDGKVSLILPNKETVLLHQIKSGFNKLDGNDVIKRAVHKLNALGYLNKI